MNRQRRGHFLLVALVVMAIVGAILLVAGRHFQGLSVRTQSAALEAQAAQLAAAARMWIDANPDRIEALAEGDSISLNAGQVQSSDSNAELTITRADNEGTIRIRARIARGRNAALLTTTVPVIEARE